MATYQAKYLRFNGATWDEIEFKTSGGVSLYANNTWTGKQTFNNIYIMGTYLQMYDGDFMQDVVFYLPPRPGVSFEVVATQQWVTANASGGPKLIRTRAVSTALSSAGSGTTSATAINVTESLAAGDTIMVELSDYSGAGYSPRVLTIHLSGTGTATTRAATTDKDYLHGWSVFNGTNLRQYGFSCWINSSNSKQIYFGAKRYIQGSFSGSTIAWTTGDYTMYVGKIWKV